MTAAIPTPPPEAEEADSLLPTIALIISTYLGYRAVTNRATLTRDQLLAPLGIAATAGPALIRVALRILSWQRTSNGHAGQELLPWVGHAVDAGVAAGVEVIEDSIVDFDDDERVDDMDERQRVIAALCRAVARAVGNSAMLEAGTQAGWAAKTWQTQGDSRVRSTHRGMHNQRRLLNEAFVAGNGVSIDYPGDPTAPADLWINCRCWMIIARQ